MVSAHWETSLPMLTGARKLATIHDFGGFPDELYAIRYDAPGAPELAQTAAALLKAAGHTAGIDGCRGIDHGAWVPLKWMYPEADVPVVQLSVQPQRGVAHHRHLGAALRSLADDGVLVVGSGHVTHNLRDWMATMRQPQAAALRRRVRRLDRKRTRGERPGRDRRLPAPRPRSRACPSDRGTLPAAAARVGRGRRGATRRAGLPRAGRRRAGDGRVPVPLTRTAAAPGSVAPGLPQPCRIAG